MEKIETKSTTLEMFLPSAGVKNDVLPQQQELNAPSASFDLPLISLNTPLNEVNFKSFGSWDSEKKRITPKKRLIINLEVIELLRKPREDLTGEDIHKLRKYSGFGGVDIDERGVLYDYYTSPPMARAGYHLLDKVKPIAEGMKVLEPSCGTGVFFDIAPLGLDLTGVELDHRPATVASILHKGVARIYNSSFEQFNLHDKTKYDIIIGNAPFGDRSVSTSFMEDPEEKNLECYFIKASLKKLRPRGVMGLIVHNGVMDNKTNMEWRAELFKYGVFIGALRLPDGSFKHAGTSVNPDFIIFQKHDDDTLEKIKDFSPERLKEIGLYNKSWIEGTYYVENPNYLLGQEIAGFRGDIIKGKLTVSKLEKAINTFVPEVYDINYSLMGRVNEDLDQSREEILKVSEEEAQSIADKKLLVREISVRETGTYVLTGGYEWEFLIDAKGPEGQKIGKVALLSQRIKEIRSMMQGEEDVKELQKAAVEIIKEYNQKFGVKHWEDKDIKRFLKKNANIKGLYEGYQVKETDPILTTPNIYHKQIDLHDGHSPAVKVLQEAQQNLKGVSKDYLYYYYPDDADFLFDEMLKHKDIFLSPGGDFLLREDFLVSNGWDLIESLEVALENEAEARLQEKIEEGIKSVREAIGWIPIESVDFKAYNSWVPADIVIRWIKEENHYSTQYYSYGHTAGQDILIPEKDYDTGKWHISHWDDKTPKSSPITRYLNNTKQLGDTDTETYNLKKDENFSLWVANNEDVRAELEKIYNLKFKGEFGVPNKTYPIEIKGWNPEIELRPIQWQTIHHLYRKNRGISALGTGFGKTFSLIGLISILRQEGKCKRAGVQVPNNKVKDWVDETNQAMPSLKVGYIANNSNDPVVRNLKLQELANGDYDIIILPESVASRIQLTPEMDEEITEDVVLGQTLGKGKTRRDQVLKEQRAKQQLMDKGLHLNKTIYFEDLRLDCFISDEGHNYKNLFNSTQARKLGMKDGKRSDRALSNFKKNEYIRRLNDGKYVFMATATPITNNPLEYYNMMMHIAPEELKRKGIYSIDDFINEFCDTGNGEIYDWKTGGISEGLILKGFKQVQELQDLFFSFTDFQPDPAKAGIEWPEDLYHSHVVEKDPVQAQGMAKLYEDIQEWIKDSQSLKNSDKEEERKEYLRKWGNANYLTFYMKMRTASLDLELLRPNKYKDWCNPKLTTLANEAWDIFNKTGAGQVVFCDRVLSGDKSFKMHEKIKGALVSVGFKENDIVIVNGMTKGGNPQSENILEGVIQSAIKNFNKGIYKIVIGTTETLGEGVNLQSNSAATHNLDIPFRPADLIQRNGRTHRQGNQQKKVKINNYMAAGTIDNYSVSLVQNKANWIDEMLSTKSNVFVNKGDPSFIDVDGLLLALTEEFGGENAVERLKEEIAEKKADAKKALNLKKIERWIGQYSIVKSSLKNARRNDSPQFQARLRKLAELEDALENNPEFKDHDLLGDSGVEFIFDKVRRCIIRLGGYYYRNDGLYQVCKIDFKKGSVFIEKTSTRKDDEEKIIEVREWEYRSYGLKEAPELKTSKQIKQAKSLYDLKLFKRQNIEFQRENFNRFLKYYSNELDLVEVTEEGKYEESSKYDYGENLNFLIPWLDQDKLMEAIDSDILDDLDLFDNPVYPKEIQDYAKQMMIKKIRNHPWYPTIKKMVLGDWGMLKDIAKKLSTKKKEVRKWDIEKMLKKLPEYEVEFMKLDKKDEDSKYEYYVRSKGGN